MKQTVDDFVHSDTVRREHKLIITKFRELVRDTFTNLTEEMRCGTEKYYGVPVYRHGKGRILVTISPTKKGITFAFSEGRSFEDRYKLLEGVGKKTLNLRIKFIEDFDAQAFTYYLKQAIKVDTQKDKGGYNEFSSRI